MSPSLPASAESREAQHWQEDSATFSLLDTLGLVFLASATLSFTAPDIVPPPFFAYTEGLHFTENYRNKSHDSERL